MTITEEKLKKPENKHGLKDAALFNEHRIDKDILKTISNE